MANPLFTLSSPPASDAQKEQAAAWFATLRDLICAEFEKIEDEYAARHGGTAGRFERTPWDRATPDGQPGGGGTMGQMKGQVFEKVGVNISTVYGHFSPEMRASIPGSGAHGAFWAAGISLVAHPANPHVPPVHMNTRHINTQQSWFGGGADLNPIVAIEADTAEFHSALKAACDTHHAEFYPAYTSWCDDYFTIKHRNEKRGVGGVFYDYHDSGDWNADFEFTADIGRAFLKIYPTLVRRHMADTVTEADRHRQLIKRGRYVEFNLLYDRGTRFGLLTGGNIDAILMSLPPLAKWE